MSYQSRFTEPLERRRLLSSAPFILPAVPGVLLPVVQPAVPAATAPTPTPTPSTTPTDSTTPVTRSTDLTGHWTGKVKKKVFFVSLDTSATLDISTQTDTALTGSIEFKGKTFSGTFVGRINPANGQFRYVLKDGKDKVTLSGKLTAKALAMTGKVSGKFLGIKVSGDFKFEKSVVVT